MRAALEHIASGRYDEALLGNCRLEWAGSEAYGVEAIGELFRGAPLSLNDGRWIEASTSVAWVGTDTALIADLYDSRIGRLWRIGAGSVPDPEPAVAVAFDPDLRQERGNVLFRIEDHPELDACAASAIETAGAALLERSLAETIHRSRAFVVRAFGGEGGGIALFALHRLGGGAVRTAGFGHAVARIDGEGCHLVIDPMNPAPWVPRL